MQTSFVLLSVLALAAVVHAGSLIDCPNPVQCVANPCDVERCLRFLNAVCVPNNCHGSCTADFFHGRNRRNVTDRCPVKTCSEKQCPGERFCIEERVPAECPQQNPLCRQYINARCVLPTDCSQLSCEVEEICIVRNEKPRCISPSRIRECREKNCEEFGLQCRQAEIDEDSFICDTPTRCTQGIASFCEESNLRCQEINGSAVCMGLIIGTTCEELSCTDDTACLLTELPSRGLAFSQCAPTNTRIAGITNCSSNPCAPESPCFERIQRGVVFGIFCPPTGCANDPSVCNERQECILDKGAEPVVEAGVCGLVVRHFNRNITDCSERPNCILETGEENQVCHAVDFEGENTIVGTVCDSEAPESAAMHL